MVDALSRSERESYLLVTFIHGDLSAPTIERYTDWTRNVSGYISTPTLEVDEIENEGTFQDKELKIALPVVDDFTRIISSGLRHSPTFVYIDELARGLFTGDNGSNRRLFAGRVMSTIKNFEGRDDTAVFFARSVKSRLKVPMGLQCNHHCAFRLFGPGCNAGGLIQGTHEQQGEIAAIDGREITVTAANPAITAPVSPGGTTDRFWERGYLKRDGHTIDIHLWKESDPTKFILRNRPPDSWLLAGLNTVSFIPGCHKTIEDCRDVWDNESQAGHFGYSIPPYNPQFESPK